MSSVQRPTHTAALNQPVQWYTWVGGCMASGCERCVCVRVCVLECVCVRVCVCVCVVTYTSRYESTLQGGSPVTGQADCEYAASEAHINHNDKR